MKMLLVVVGQSILCCERNAWNLSSKIMHKSLRFKSQFSLSTVLDGKLPQFYCHIKEINRINSLLLQVSMNSILIHTLY